MKTTYLTLSLSLLALTAPSAFATGSCAKFSGNYTVSGAGCFESHDGGTFADSTYTGLNISAQPTNDQLSMYYEEGSDQGYAVNYIADGQEHPGDVNNSGKTYTATCDATQILSTRNGMFIAPLQMSFVANSDGTYTLSETITGTHPFTRSCSMSRAR